MNERWIDEIVEWRTKAEAAPRPFVTPPLRNSAIYLCEEAGELLAAVHKLSRPKDLRNPDSARQSIADEVGDVMLMLGTVAHLAGYSELRYSKDLWTPDDGLLPLRAALSLVQATSDVAQATLDGTALDPFFGLALDKAYSLVKHVVFVTALQVDPVDAMRTSMRKIEARAGL